MSKVTYKICYPLQKVMHVTRTLVKLLQKKSDASHYTLGSLYYMFIQLSSCVCGACDSCVKMMGASFVDTLFCFFALLPLSNFLVVCCLSRIYHYLCFFFSWVYLKTFSWAVSPILVGQSLSLLDGSIIYKYVAIYY